jgi:hypothetical protein
VPNYTPSYSSGCSGSIVAGETTTCTITNSFTPPPDTQPPQVLSFTISPMRVSLSSGGTITIAVHVTDQTGVELVGAFIQDQCGVGPGFFQSLQLPLVSGTAQDGVYQATFTFTQSAYDRILPYCSSNGDVYFQSSGIAIDTLGNTRGLPLIEFVTLTP